MNVLVSYQFNTESNSEVPNEELKQHLRDALEVSTNPKCAAFEVCIYCIKTECNVLFGDLEILKDPQINMGSANQRASLESWSSNVP